jgi:hypothetical protein
MSFSIGAWLLLAAAVGQPATTPRPTPVTGGVYLTAQDFASGTLAGAGACPGSFKVALHDVLNKPFVDVSGTETKRYAKSAVFGFRKCDGRDYRLVSNHLYRIVGKGEMFVYVTERPVSQGKGFRVVPSYYFSSGPRGDVRPLTVEHLQEAFGTNRRFIDSLGRFSDQDLAQYDAYRQQFKVARLLSESTIDR